MPIATTRQEHLRARHLHHVADRLTHNIDNRVVSEEMLAERPSEANRSVAQGPKPSHP
jgi:hypothetical protein